MKYCSIREGLSGTANKLRYRNKTRKLDLSHLVVRHTYRYVNVAILIKLHIYSNTFTNGIEKNVNMTCL